MNLIYIMRHGESSVNVKRQITCRKLDGDLSDLGREQAANAASWLSDKGITTIYHSPFHRAEQTAGIVAERLGIVPIWADGLREMDCGDLEGRMDEDAWADWKVVFDRWLMADRRATFPGGESYQNAFERYSQTLSDLPPGETVLLVTHGGITMTVLPYLCVNAAALQRERYLVNTGLVVLEPYDDGRYICRAWNLAEHLGEVHS